MAEPSSIVVLGTPDSGAPALANALSRLGWHPVPPNDLLQWSRRCMAAFQLHEHSVRELPLSWHSYPQASAMRGELERLLSTLPKPWVTHQSSASQLLPVYRAAFEFLKLGARYVLCVGPPGGTPHDMGVWMSHALGALERLPEGSVVVSSDRLFADPEGELRRIVGTKVALEGALSAIPQLPSAKAALPEGLLGLVKETSEVLGQLATGQDAAERLRQVTEQYRQWRAMLAPPGNPGTQAGLMWVERGIVQTAETPFLPTGDWQTVRLKVPAPAHTVVSGLLYARPCRVWLRKSLWRHMSGYRVAAITAGPGSVITESPGVIRLDGVYESHQISLRTPTEPGPYELELELLLEAGPQINVEAAGRLAMRLETRRHAP